jgi:ABC-2 type transport system ATP-binding protein
MLKINDFTKVYQGSGKIAADRVTIDVKAGDLYGFIGHNGAGKTTTIRAIAGVLDFEQGSIEIDGISIKDNPVEAKKKIAYIPDNPDLYEFLTGIAYLNFIADIFDVDKVEREALIKKYADLFELTANLGDMIASYSHGMKQKLAIISALIHKPKLLILDEPFVGLDPKAAHTLKTIMTELCKDGGAIFFSTHVLEVAEKLCNKIAII